jgi:hypothetical protein
MTDDQLHRELVRMACDLVSKENEVRQLRAERDEARRRMNSILTEIDCRIEHGAESNGHLEVLRDMFKENTDEYQPTNQPTADANPRIEQHES